MVTEASAELEGPSGRYVLCNYGLPSSAVRNLIQQILRTDCRPKYDDLLSNPTADTQAAGHTRASAAYKQKVGLLAELSVHCQLLPCCAR